MELAAWLGLQHHIGHIAREMSRLGSCSHSHRLGRVLEAWRSDSPHTFTLHTLLSVLRRAELHQAELWVRILTAPHYQQTSRAPSACSLGCSQDSLTAGLLNISQDSGVADLSTSMSSADTRSLDCVVKNMLVIIYIPMSNILFTLSATTPV